MKRLGCFSTSAGLTQPFHTLHTSETPRRAAGTLPPVTRPHHHGDRPGVLLEDDCGESNKRSGLWATFSFTVTFGLS